MIFVNWFICFTSDCNEKRTDTSLTLGELLMTNDGCIGIVSLVKCNTELPLTHCRQPRKDTLETI